MSKFKEFYLTHLLEKEKSEFQKLKDNKVDLTPEERKEAMDQKCVWHFGNHNNPTCAIWKSILNGKSYFISNTHRCFQKSPTLKGAIKDFEFVKTTA